MAGNRYNAIVIGSGPNGLAAAITLQKAGLSVLLIEAEDVLGGGVRSAPLTLPGFLHDVCSSVYALAEDSPVFKSLGLQRYGLEYLKPEYALAHPLEDGSAAIVQASLENTAAGLGRDADSYRSIFSPYLREWREIRSAFVAPLHASSYSGTKARFARQALSSGIRFAQRHFSSKAARALFAGMAAHAMVPLNTLTTSSIALVLNTLAHVNGWPVAKGGSQQLTNALAACFENLGGEIQTGNRITSLSQLPAAEAVLLDVTPAQLLTIAGDRLPALYKWQLQKYKYGAGVFKVDWALSEPAPFTNALCKRAGTVHIGGSMQAIRESEDLISKNKHPDQPFVLFVQPTAADKSRAPEGRHTGWAYCHVPNGSTKNLTEAIEQQIERFAPGFRDCILARHTINTAEMQRYNENYIGGDINGGAATPGQLFTRPVLRLSPYRTAAKGIYVCSSSTPPGGGVHGICGYYAARRALRDLFHIKLPFL